MHARNIYKKRLNFKDVINDHQNLRKYVSIDLSGEAKYDFKNPEALAELTKTLLQKDFNLKVDFPITRLVPTLPLRLNYILWIEDLLKAALPKTDDVVGIDIGTGASCIYPLLAAKQGWKIIATEADKESANIARKNVENNALSHAIDIREVSEADHLLVGVLDEAKTYHFCMCNPPFFELNSCPSNRTGKRPPPKNAITGTSTELSVSGGEVEFITKIIEESKVLKDKIMIYTTMVGRKCDIGVLKNRIREAKARSVVQGEFCQGNTTRWFLAWSYTFDLVDEKIVEEKKSKQATPIIWTLDEVSVKGVVDRLKELFTSLEVNILYLVS